MILRPPAGPGERARLLELNHDHVDVLSPMDADRLDALVAVGARVEVLDDGAMAGFVVTVGPGLGYDSENYAWFTDRYGAGFLYLDRVVVEPHRRRQGVADAAYALVEERAREHGRLALEVNEQPANHASLAFHGRRGFTPVGVRHEPGGKRVRMLVKEVGGSPDSGGGGGEESRT